MRENHQVNQESPSTKKDTYAHLRSMERLQPKFVCSSVLPGFGAIGPEEARTTLSKLNVGRLQQEVACKDRKATLMAPC